MDDTNTAPVSNDEGATPMPEEVKSEAPAEGADSAEATPAE